MPSTDLAMMQRALMLAERGRGRVEPNPLVGAVVVQNDAIVGEGFHEHFGGPHAEVHALHQAGPRAAGATLYVTLEPCCHHGKTPPCTDGIIGAGIRRVVAAIGDPFPAVAGGGFICLRDAGIEVDVGVGEVEARRQNAPFLKLVTRHRPYVIAKWAMTMDGKIATRTGESRWITSERARERVHELRRRMDAIIAGIVTVLMDDPLLTARPPGPRMQTRVILDSQLRLPLDSQLVRTAREFPVMVLHSPNANPAAKEALEKAGCTCHPCQPSGGPICVGGLLNELGRRRFTNVLVEGGATVLGSFLEAREIDEVWAFVAPKILGGEKAPSPISGVGIAKLAHAIAIDHWEVDSFGPDVLLRGQVSRPDASETSPPP